MSYENMLIREMTGCASGDTTCSDCNQVVCACESLADWHRERDNNFPVPVLADSEPSDSGGMADEARESTVTVNDTLEATEESRGGEHLQEPTSFSEWLNQTGDSI